MFGPGLQVTHGIGSRRSQITNSAWVHVTRHQTQLPHNGKLRPGILRRQHHGHPVQNILRGRRATLAAGLIGYSHLMAGHTQSVTACDHVGRRHTTHVRCQSPDRQSGGRWYALRIPCPDSRIAVCHRTLDTPDTQRFRCRVGSNDEDVLVDAHDSLGDAVRVAVRLKGPYARKDWRNRAG